VCVWVWMVETSAKVWCDVSDVCAMMHRLVERESTKKTNLVRRKGSKTLFTFYSAYLQSYSTLPTSHHSTDFNTDQA
jgi:hypothetical protein